MSEHISDLLSAYLDGELQGGQLNKVKAHLGECQGCRAELSSLQDLSQVLQSEPSPDFPPVDRFAGRVMLQLPRQLPRPTYQKVFDFGWWAFPVGLVAVWIFLSTTSLMSNLIVAAGDMGVLNESTAWLDPGTSGSSYLLNAFESFGFLENINLDWVERTNAVLSSVLPGFIWQASIAILYLSWIAFWWARNQRQGSGQLLEG